MKYFILGMVILLSTSSCGKDDNQAARDSLVGSWNVSKINRIVTDTQSGNTLQEEESGALGNFDFTYTEMEYDYIFSNSTTSSTQDYTLDISKENSGFIQVTRYDIRGNQEDFRVRFGDETSDAHCNATMITLETDFVQDLLNISLVLQLNKQ